MFVLRMMLVVLTMVAVMHAESNAEEMTAIRIMSFNVRYGTAKDGENAWEHRRDLLVETIQKQAPDIIGTQECLSFQADFIVEQLPEYRWFGIGRERNGGGEHMAILYRKDRFSPITIDNFWLSENPEIAGSMAWGAGIPRMVTYAKFRHIPSGAQFHFFNTHFDHQSEEARVNSAKLLRDRASMLDDDLPVIITGDFNSSAERSEAWTILTQGGFTDTWLSAETKTGPTGTFCGFRDPKPDGSRIDWILYRGGVSVRSSESVAYSKDGRYPSDHLPVVAELVLAK